MEELMYYVWQQKMFQSIQNLDETELTILSPGIRNLDAGPDFFNARIEIDGTIWAGNVEMHVKSSDWFRHHHHNDRTYDSVILHVVLQADAEIRLHDGEIVKTVVMKIPQEIINKYKELTTKNPYSFSAISCKDSLPSVPSIILHDWQTSLAVKRLLNKVNKVRDIIDNKQKSWPEALYVILCRALGTGINSDTCERLARSLPYAYLQKHANNINQLKALLIGQASLIDNEDLQKEYNFLRAKFQLNPISKEAWKMSKIRPASSPQNRLLALAYIINRHPNLFSEIIECQSIKELTTLLYTPKLLGSATIRSVIINAVIPIMIGYGEWQSDSEICEKAIALLEDIPAESNRYMDYWVACGIPLRNALETQGMLQLYKEYCEPHKCMSCRFCCWILKNKRQ